MTEERRRQITQLINSSPYNDIAITCVEFGISRSEACQVNPNYYWELYCEDKYED